eukprot:COSAG03_NODE_13863_length_485_cov_1.663212_1_plen_93_part_10
MGSRARRAARHDSTSRPRRGQGLLLFIQRRRLTLLHTALRTNRLAACGLRCQHQDQAAFDLGTETVTALPGAKSAHARPTAQALSQGSDWETT